MHTTRQTAGRTIRRWPFQRIHRIYSTTSHAPAETVANRVFAAKSVQHTTREKLLEATATDSRVIESTLDEDISTDVDDEVFLLNDKATSPGTFVELRRNFQVKYGIALHEHLDGNSMGWITVLTTSGNLREYRRDDVMFEVPALVSADLATRCGLATSPTVSELNARISAVKTMTELVRAIKAEQMLIGKSFATFSQQLTTKSMITENGQEKISLHQAAHILAPARSTKVTTLIAIQGLMFDDHVRFIADTQNYLSSRMFGIRPQKYISDIANVTTMCRQRTHLEAFASRAKPIILKNRARFQDTRQQDISQKSVETVYTPEDLVFIRFLLEALQPRRSIQRDAYAMAATIIRAFGSYEGDINEPVIYQAVRELGAISPWQDLVSLRRDLNVDLGSDKNHTKSLVKSSTATQSDAAPSSSLMKATSMPLGADDLIPQDELAHMRHDFGSLPVFIIDDISAQELDDGISIERIPNDPTHAWIHVHIADPTAVLHPNHNYAKRARTQHQTIYLPQRSWPMLPHELVSERLSLGTVAKTGQPENVMTFSTKIDMNTGRISDFKIRAAVIRNVHNIDYDSVDHAIGRKNTFRREYLFGTAAAVRHFASLNTEHVSDLKDILNLVDLVTENGYALGSAPFPARASVTISPKPLYGGPLKLEQQSLEFSGFPRIEYMLEGGQESLGLPAKQNGSRDAIAAFAILTGHMTSIWALERGIPLMRRGSTPTEETRQTFQEFLHDGNAKDNWVGFVRSGVAIPTAKFTTEPREHFSLNIPANEGYSQVTSPLRRYVDLVNHWQIKHALLNDNNNLSRGHPFSSDWMRNFAVEANIGQIINLQVQRAASRFWSLAKLAGLWRPEIPLDELPPPLDCLKAVLTNIYDTKDSLKGIFHRSVYIEQLGIAATVIFEDQSISSSLRRGDEIAVRIKDITMGNKSTLYVALR